MFGCLKKVLLKSFGLAPKEAVPKALKGQQQQTTCVGKSKAKAAARAKARAAKANDAAKAAAKAAKKAERAVHGRANRALKSEMKAAAANESAVVPARKPQTVEASSSSSLEQLRPKVLSPLYVAKTASSVRARTGSKATSSLDKENVSNSSPVSEEDEDGGDKITPLNPGLFPSYTHAANRLGSADSQLTSYSSLGGDFDYGSDVEVESVTPVKLNMAY